MLLSYTLDRESLKVSRPLLSIFQDFVVLSDTFRDPHDGQAVQSRITSHHEHNTLQHAVEYIPLLLKCSFPQRHFIYPIQDEENYQIDTIDGASSQMDSENELEEDDDKEEEEDDDENEDSSSNMG